MNYQLPTLLVFFLLSHHIHANVASRSVLKCLDACQNTQNMIKANLCIQCINSPPPPDYELCMTSCKQSDRNTWLFRLCRHCFLDDRILMNDICIHACGWIRRDDEDKTICALEGCAALRQ